MWPAELILQQLCFSMAAVRFSPKGISNLTTSTYDISHTEVMKCCGGNFLIILRDQKDPTTAHRHHHQRGAALREIGPVWQHCPCIGSMMPSFCNFVVKSTAVIPPTIHRNETYSISMHFYGMILTSENIYINTHQCL